METKVALKELISAFLEEQDYGFVCPHTLEKLDSIRKELEADTAGAII